MNENLFRSERDLMPVGRLELGPSQGSGSKFEPDFRLEVNKFKAQTRPSLIFKSSIELFLIHLLNKTVGLDKI